MDLITLIGINEIISNFAVGSGSNLYQIKILPNLNGSHLISYVINAAKNISEIDDFVVTSDSKKYLEIAKT